MGDCLYNPWLNYESFSTGRFCQHKIFSLKVVVTEMRGNGDLAYDCSKKEQECKLTKLGRADTVLLVQ